MESKLRSLGKYDLIARIGKGGMAEVYLARQRGLMDFEKIVVVKTIHPHLAQQKDFIDMLLDEARISARIEHPCVVDIYDLGCDQDTYFIAMEHLAGQPLLRVLRAGVEKKPLDIRSMVRIIADVADGLHAAHELKDHHGKSFDLIHRDVTPGNIVILYNGRVKILDFGIAKARNRVSADTGARRWKGKLSYMAPEHVGGQPIDRRSDIFSLGVVMWEAFTLRRLFKHKNPAAMAEAVLSEPIDPPSQHREGIPRKLDSICMRALARDPDERYSTAAELQEDLERFLSAVAFRPQKNVIAEYMREMFADEIAEREELLREAAEATSEIQVAMEGSPDIETSLPDITVPPAELGDADSDPGTSGDATGSGPTASAAASGAAGAAATPPTSGATPIAARNEQARARTTGSRAAAARPDSPGPASAEMAAATPSRADSAADWYATDSEIRDRAADMLDAVSLDNAPRISDVSSRTFIRVLLGAVIVLAIIVLLAVILGGGDDRPSTAADGGDGTGVAETTGQLPTGDGIRPADPDSPPDDPATPATPDGTPDPDAAAPATDTTDPASPRDGDGGSQGGARGTDFAGGDIVEGIEEVDDPDGTENGVTAEDIELIGDPNGNDDDDDSGEGDEGDEGDEGEDSGDDKAAKEKRAARLKARKARVAKAKGLYQQGIDLFLKGQKQKARDKFRDALEAHSGYAPAHRGLGTVYESLGKKSLAAKSYRTYLRLAPKARDAAAIRKRLKGLGE